MVSKGKKTSANASKSVDLLDDGAEGLGASRVLLFEKQI